MGILNVTPDSFSDGGDHPTHIDAIAAAYRLIAEGADILDIGGESTRPGSTTITPAEEQARILPVIAALRDAGIPISVDSRNAATMAAALAAGASIVNDVSALRHDPAAAALVAAAGCPVILMHMRGTPGTMNSRATYTDVVAEVAAELAERLRHAVAAGVAPAQIAIDPGIGFAKTADHNLAVLRGLPTLAALGYPLVVGVSRKRFIGSLSGEPDPKARGPGSLAAALFALQRGSRILRVHDVAATVQAVKVWQALSA